MTVGKHKYDYISRWLTFEKCQRKDGTFWSSGQSRSYCQASIKCELLIEYMDRELRPSSNCAWAQSGLAMNCLYTAWKFRRSVFLQKTYFDSFTCILCPGPCFRVVNPYPVNIFCSEILSDFLRLRHVFMLLSWKQTLHV